MKKSAYLKKGKERDLIDALGTKANLFVPCLEGEAVIFKPAEPGCTLCLSRPAVSPPKGAIYPQSETLFSFTFKKDPEDQRRTLVDLDDKIEAPETIIFGARPCDARGIAVIDRAFSQTDTPDPYYLARREKTTIVTLTCPEPSTGCFCTWVGCGPADTSDSDVMMTEVEDGYLLEALTTKGQAILESPALEDGTAYEARAKEVRKTVHERMVKEAGETDTTPVNPETFHSQAFWEKAAERCLGCGACTYLCPTCYCFNITDEQVVDKGERIRSWDACMFHHFTLEASGHNPRTAKALRLKNRIGHKFVYYGEKYDGITACSGCGRCIRGCPVSMEISTIAAALKKNSGTVSSEQ
jgi:sulfhydrogenase subunit beta (sulfur reductase)